MPAAIDIVTNVRYNIHHYAYIPIVNSGCGRLLSSLLAFRSNIVRTSQPRRWTDGKTRCCDWPFGDMTLSGLVTTGTRGLPTKYKNIQSSIVTTMQNAQRHNYAHFKQ
jgi:hypothetical protein